MDAEKFRQLQEHQNKLTMYAQQAKQIQSRIRSAEYDAKKGDLTKQEVTAYSEDATLYTAIGKAFVLSNRDDVVSSLDEDIKLAREEAAKMKSSFDYTQRQARETESYIRELLESSPALAKSILGDAGAGAGAGAGGENVEE